MQAKVKGNQEAVEGLKKQDNPNIDLVNRFQINCLRAVAERESDQSRYRVLFDHWHCLELPMEADNIKRINF